ncbi:hypothetical protein predicted by Glimmer/Critica [Limosilactobacillus fermentum]|nr:hypothetical protein predicted by Glimmer/Critica [Limosilactobacillus fermentum]SJM47095.1 hypothetical protein FM122_02680 [Limosilactobacillus fermentum]SJM50911.1 hypothetical protein FM123_02855 [Limosilactobacillus fermentum]
MIPLFWQLFDHPGRHPGHNCVSGDVFSHHRTAATTTLSPIVTPGKIVAFPPI